METGIGTEQAAFGPQLHCVNKVHEMCDMVDGASSQGTTLNILLLLNSISRAALLEEEPARAELRPERLGHGAVHHEAETEAQRVQRNSFLA